MRAKEEFEKLFGNKYVACRKRAFKMFEYGYKNGQNALRQALEQEPWDTSDMAHRAGGLSMGKEWVGLTDDQVNWMWFNDLSLDHLQRFRVLEAVLKEKNT